MSDLFEMCAEYTKQQCESAQDDRYDSDAEDFKRESKQLMLDNPIILQNQINPPDWQEQQEKDEEEMKANPTECHIETDSEYAKRIQEIE